MKDIYKKIYHIWIKKNLKTAEVKKNPGETPSKNPWTEGYVNPYCCKNASILLLLSKFRVGDWISEGMHHEPNTSDRRYDKKMILRS